MGVKRIVVMLCIGAAVYGQSGPGRDNGDGSKEKCDGSGAGSGHEVTSVCGSSEPSPEEKAYNAAVAARAAAMAEMTNGKVKTEAEIRAIAVQIVQAEKEVAITKAALEASQGGDPVLVTTGRYLLEEADYEGVGSGFEIRRKYVSEDKIGGSNGFGWSVSYAERFD